MMDYHSHHLDNGRGQFGLDAPSEESLTAAGMYK